MTLREIVYMIMDELKIMSDDSYFNEDHIKFLVNKYRVYLLNQTYKKDISSKPADSNYQKIEVSINNFKEEDNPSFLSNKGVYAKSVSNIPNILDISNTKITTNNSKFGYRISLVSSDRMKFVGYNKWMKNIIYCTIEDNKLYLYSYYEDLDIDKDFKIIIKGIFEDAEIASNTDVNAPNIIDIEYPLESSLVPLLIQSVVQELAQKTIQPEDSQNNASDDKSNLHRYVASNTKSDLAKQLT